MFYYILLYFVLFIFLKRKLENSEIRKKHLNEKMKSMKIKT